MNSSHPLDFDIGVAQSEKLRRYTREPTDLLET
jgi:hypothetical protein